MGVLFPNVICVDFLAEGGMGNVWGFVFTGNKRMYFSFQYFGAQL